MAITSTQEGPAPLGPRPLGAAEEQSIGELLKSEDNLPKLHVMGRVANTIVMRANDTIPFISKEEFAGEAVVIEAFIASNSGKRALNFYDSKGPIKTESYTMRDNSKPRYIIFADTGIISKSNAPYIRSSDKGRLAVINQLKPPLSGVEEIMYRKGVLINLLGAFARVNGGSVERTKNVLQDLALGVSMALQGASFEEYAAMVTMINDKTQRLSQERLTGIISSRAYQQISVTTHILPAPVPEPGVSITG
jgi:hypothetical protein